MSTDEESSSQCSSRSRSPRSRSRSATPRPHLGREALRENELLAEENAALKEQVKQLTKQLAAMNKNIESLTRTIEQMREDYGRRQAPPAEEKAPQQPEVMDTAPPSTSGIKRTAPEEGHSSGDETAQMVKKVAKPSTSRQVSIEANVVQSAALSVSDAPPAMKIPPIVLRKKDSWTAVSSQLRRRGIEFTKARMVGEGIQILPTTADHYRRMTKYFAEAKYEYHTYALPEERQLRVVIRGLPDGVTDEEIKEDLQSQGFSVDSVQRMTCRRTRRSMPLALAKLPLTQEKILEVTRCCSLVVRVERQREQQLITQCFRCQRYGHAQGKCTAQAKCVKCGEAHPSSTCKKAREQPAKCANCQGAHPASYRGCPSCPKPRKVAPTVQAPRKPAQAAAVKSPAPRTPPRSFAEAARAGRRTEPIAPKNTISGEVTAASLTAALAQMQQMCSAMGAFFAQMPALLKR